MVLSFPIALCYILECEAISSSAKWHNIAHRTNLPLLQHNGMKKRESKVQHVNSDSSSLLDCPTLSLWLLNVLSLKIA